MTAATVIIETWSGTSPTYTDVTSSNIRYRNDDSPFTNDATAPISVPDADHNYSYWITMGLNITAIGDATNIDNVRFYPDGTLGWSMGTGGCINVLQLASEPHGIATGAYDQATSAEDLSNHTSYNSAVDLYTTYTGSEDTMYVDATDYTSAGRTKAVVIQAKVGVSAPAGTQTGETLTFTYDEI